MKYIVKIVQEARYHPKNLVEQYIKAACMACKNIDWHDRNDKLCDGIALAEFASVFKLSNFAKLYFFHVKKLELEQHDRLHSTQMRLLHVLSMT